jgi:phosphatidate phosphatase APP1
VPERRPFGALRTREAIGCANTGVEPPGWQGARRAHTPRYATDEQRRQPGWIGGQIAQVIAARVLTIAALALVLLTPPPAGARTRPAVVVIYNGLGTPAGARVWGRAFADKEPGAATPSESKWRKLRRTLNELESEELRHAELELKVLGRSYPVKADSEGLFRVDLKGPLAEGSHRVEAKLKVPARAFRVEEGKLLVWPKRPGVAVLSDIDDTVLQTGVTDKLQMIKRVLFSNAHDLKTFDQAPALFQAWSKRGYPVVFVSGSPVNLYTRLTQFFSLRGFPTPVLLLKNLGLERGADSLTDQRAYKLRRIREVLELLPGYKLLLVGDSGEKDPEIYSALRQGNKGIVLEIMIHRVTREEKIATRFAGQLVFDTYSDLAKELRRLGRLTPADVKAMQAPPATKKAD